MIRVYARGQAELLSWKDTQIERLLHGDKVLLLLHVKAPQALLPELGLNAMLALTTSVKIIL